MKPLQTIHIQRYTSPCGVLLLGACEGELCLCDWAEGRHRLTTDRKLLAALHAQYVETPSDVTAEAARQLDEYFAGRRHEFQLPLRFAGTDFQRLVWQELLQIHYGHTLSYAELAARINRPTAVRAVAAANAHNPISIVAACHRVIGSDGSLTGYGGGLPAKRFLLALEAQHAHAADDFGQ
jgi:methylated-DNA-[protein]-cysteine S-methyltransferase